MNKNKTLLVVDIQEDATGITTKKPYENSLQLIDNVNSIINYCEKKGITIIYIKHELNGNLLNKLIMGNKFIKGTSGSEIDSRVKVINKNIFSKNIGDALSNPKLVAFLKEKKIDDVYVVGLDAAACVYKTAQGATKRGYRAVVIKDAIVTSNMKKIPKILDNYKKKGILVSSIKEFIKID